MKNSFLKIKLFLFFSLLFTSCQEGEPTAKLSLLSIRVDGTTLRNNAQEVSTQALLQLVFSRALDPTRFESSFQLSAGGVSVSNLSFSYTNASAGVSIQTQLAPNTDYNISISPQALGQNGEVLDQSFAISFRTDDGSTNNPLPCTSASGDCLEEVSLSNGSGNNGNFEFYASYAIDSEPAPWNNLKSAIIVVHGQNRNADDYFGYMMNSLLNEGLANESLLISPFFKSSGDAQSGDLFWSGSTWREGQNSADAATISSFEVLDDLVEVLGDPTDFPALEKIIITGHSSGALFTQAYAAANQVEDQYPDIDFQYVVANSQYFYYPDDVRYNSNTQQFENVDDCATFNHWPLGFINPPPYLNGISESEVDQQIVERKVLYLLGTNDTVTTGTLNTDDCEALRLGENRFIRGENIFRLMENNYPSTNQSEKIIVNNVGHNAQGMYQSPEFLTWLRGAL